MSHSLAEEGSITRSAPVLTRLKLGGQFGLGHRRGHGTGRENKGSTCKDLGELHLDQRCLGEKSGCSTFQDLETILIPFTTRS